MPIKKINDAISRGNGSGMWWFNINVAELDYVGLMADINKSLGCKDTEFAIIIKPYKHMRGYELKRFDYKVCKKYGITVNKVQEALIAQFF